MVPQQLALILMTSASALLAGGAPVSYAAVRFGPAAVWLDGRAAPRASLAVCGFSLIAGEEGPQVAVTGHPSRLVVSLFAGETVEISVPVQATGGATIAVDVELIEGEHVKVALADDGGGRWEALDRGASQTLECSLDGDGTIQLQMRSEGEVAVQISGWVVRGSEGVDAVELEFPSAECGTGPPPIQPPMRPAIERALIEWDWRMQDGIGTEREPSTFAAAIERTLKQGDLLLAHLEAQGIEGGRLALQWEAKRRQFESLLGAGGDSPHWEALWREVHWLRRGIVLSNPRAARGPIAFIKHVPSMFSHQLTQYYGADARPGGGVFVLEQPGRSMAVRPLAAELPLGAFQHLDVDYDGRRLLFAFAKLDCTPRQRHEYSDRYFDLYEVGADGSGLRRLTEGPFDDFAPRYLPDGNIVFISTRRGGFHRCGRGPCSVYTLTLLDRQAGEPRVVSFHETHEWDPAVLHDGRIAYTRWDYVDRDAVHYQHLWSVRPDGSNPRILFGNNTFNPVGIWEPRAVPGSHRVMATAGAHHAMTAGSIILVDPARGVDGPIPLTRLTPDALFPESESPLYLSEAQDWRAPRGVPRQPEVPVEERRWPGHCYRSPYPFSEACFLAAYSFDRLIGEPTMNPVNMFGIYLVDRFGNKELLYRDLNVSSLWPMPLASRPRPPVLPSFVDKGLAEANAGTFFVQNVHAAWPELPPTRIERLRIVQVLPKSTPHMDDPPVGAARGAPGKQVLGTVRVEPDGSAHFSAPAGVPLSFQALDEHGQAVQTMRSLTYLQPGEQTSCVGCHEHRMTAPLLETAALALEQPPAEIVPGPEGSRPFSFPRLVQPVLDRHCVTCHSRDDSSGGVVLTGEPDGRFSAAYNALVTRVRYSSWGAPHNGEPLTQPGYFGAINSPLVRMLREGHEGVELDEEDWERLITWMDVNALFYGTFNPADQARQLRGEQIAGPEVE